MIITIHFGKGFAKGHIVALIEGGSLACLLVVTEWENEESKYRKEGVEEW